MCFRRAFTVDLRLRVALVGHVVPLERAGDVRPVRVGDGARLQRERQRADVDVGGLGEAGGILQQARRLLVNGRSLVQALDLLTAPNVPFDPPDHAPAPPR